MNEKIEQIREEVSKVVVGQSHMVDALIMGLLTDGHILLEGVPGLAKTTTVNALAQSLGLMFSRVQFTPDLLPSDIIGAEIYDMKLNEFKIKKGPVFTNLLLADEINRAPAKVQSALLEVMQEKQVTIGDKTFKIDPPFLVLATQNPVEQEGAYSLPEAQLDRFMFKIVLGYNTFEEEYEVAERVSSNTFGKIENALSKEELQSLKDEVKTVFLDDELKKYIVTLIYASREPEKYGLSEIDKFLQFGASPRATIDMFKAVKAKAFIEGRNHVITEDIIYIARDILRHRIILSYEAEALKVTTDEIIQKIIEVVPAP
jgi:MoxR-like ATPase